MPRELMANAYYGDELAKLAAGVHRTRMGLHYGFHQFRGLHEPTWTIIDGVVQSHFSVAREGVFGGQITAGDGWFIGAWMAAMRPSSMIEVGVASGYSSALILSFAKALGLLQAGTPYLHSFDLQDTHDGGHVTGSVLQRDFPDLAPFWSLRTKETTATLDGDALNAQLPDGRVMAFLDGGHNHPWPAVDLAFLWRYIKRCDWALMQDTQMVERWAYDGVAFDVPVLHPIRGAQIAAAHWPGRKVFGEGMCYNMAAVAMQIDVPSFAGFCGSMARYMPEVAGDQIQACESFFRKLGYAITPTE